MIYFYSGTPGSGKSLRTARDIVQKLTIKKQNVISNIEIDFNYIRKKSFSKKLKKVGKDVGRYFYLENNYMTVDFLMSYAKKYHKLNVESQTLLIIDEAQLLFAPTVIKIKSQEDKNYRNEWLKFFTQHRKLGFNVILVSQFDRLIDPQIRCLFEYEFRHRKVNNFKMGAFFSMLKLSLFCSVSYWYGVKEKIGVEFFTYQKKYSKIYNSYKFH